MCLYPRLIQNKKYTANKKNNGNIPKITDERVLTVPIGCGQCMECRKQKARQWSIRLQEEIRTNKYGEFVTLTFSNESITKLYKEINGTGYAADNAIATLATRRFLERWRKKYKISIKHWLVTELGHNGTENIHLHGILFKNEYKHDLKGIKEQYLQEQKADIEKIWQYGYVYIGDYVNEKTINYCVKYSTKIDLKHKEYNAKILTSAGIGSNYTQRLDAQLNKYKTKGQTDETYYTRTGQKINLPIYWRNKIYTEEEREKLWLEKLDKGERWVDGTKINIKNGEEKYFKALKHAQKKNLRLGYKNGNEDEETKWSKIYYENQLRELKIKKRLKENLENTIEETTFGIVKFKTKKQNYGKHK